MSSSLLQLNTGKEKLGVFYAQPLFMWDKIDFRFIDTKRSISEYFIKVRQPLVDSFIELQNIEVDLDGLKLQPIICSGIEIGWQVSMPSNYKVELLHESLICKPPLIKADELNPDIDIALSLPQLQVMRLDNDLIMFVVRNDAHERFHR